MQRHGILWKAVCLVTTLIMICTPLTAFAEDGLPDGGGTQPGTEEPVVLGSGTITSDDMTKSCTWTVTEGGKASYVIPEEEAHYTLTIEGDGAMPDFTKDYAFPWHEWSNGIHDIVFGEGVTKVGKYTAADLKALSYIDISKDVKTVGAYAFKTREIYEYCQVKFSINLRTIGTEGFKSLSYVDKTLTLPEGLETIGDKAFYNLECNRIVLPKTLKSIGKSLVGDWIGIEYPIKFTGTKKQLLNVKIKKAGNSFLLKNAVTCSNGKSYVRNNSRTWKISYTKSLVYNGKKRTPKVTVKNGLGTTLKKGVHYKITYYGKRVKYGKYRIKVTPITSSTYMGPTRSVYFKIKPQSPRITKVQYCYDGKTPSIDWKTPNYKKVDGVEIQYSTDPNFKKDVHTDDEPNLVCGSSRFPKMKRGKLYYFRVRVWVYASNDILYSKWSKVVKKRYRK